MLFRNPLKKGHRFILSIEKYLQVTSLTVLGHSVADQVPSGSIRLSIDLITLFIKSSNPKLLHNTGTKFDNQTQFNRKTDTEAMLRVFYSGFF